MSMPTIDDIARYALSAGPGYWYLATPYTKYPGGRVKAFEAAATVAGHLLQREVPVFCPITHSHPIACNSTIKDDDYSVWLPLDHHFMANAVGIIVAMLPSWETSYGVKVELEYFQGLGKPVLWLATPDFDLPQEPSP